VQHLNFRSSLPATAQPAPTTAPAPAKQIEPAGAKPPKRLPRTGSEDNTAWIWLAFGMALLLFGGLVGFGPVMGGKSPALVLRTHAANSALLRGLLAAPVRPARPTPRKPAPPSATSDDLLAALLGVEARRGDVKR
jgi:LPXTG-motif cell wall-anchored protein